jgi:hypothetical protein
MLLRISVVVLLVFSLVSAVAANSTDLTREDFIIKQLPSGKTIQVGKPLTFTPDNARIYLEHNYQTGQDYVCSVTLYGKDYETNKGICVGDPVGKVKERYGEPNRPSGTKSHYKWISYIDRHELLKVHFFLDKETEEVIAINFTIYPVGEPPMIKLADGEYH